MNRVFKLFSDSFGEFRSTRNLTLMALLLALNIILSFLSINPFPYLRVSFGFLALAVAGMMFGPTVGMIVGAAGDIISFIIKPTGAFNPLLTLVAALGGLIWGLFLYKNKGTLLRVIFARTSIVTVCNLICTTAILCLLFGSVFQEIFPLRVIKNLCALPVEIALTYFVCKVVTVIRVKTGWAS